ncbi:MAG: hypothetical protein JXA37_11025 [Chloroflexia bacterium]|nr:hypothetical protein [Chloroflexia bacterium]
MHLAEQLQQLESSGLLRLARIEPELEYLFRHALVQEAAYQSLLQEDRRRLHQSVGQVIERLYSDRLEEQAGILAQHFFQAQDYERAGRYFIMAGEVAFRQYAIPEAIAHYSRALELVPQIETLEADPLQQVYMHLGRALELNAQYERALERYAELEHWARQCGNAHVELAAVIEQAKIRSTPNRCFDREQGATLSRRTLDLALELGDRAAQARIHWILMMSHWLQGESEPMLWHGERSLALARQLGLRDQLAYTLQDIHRAYLNNNRLDEAQAALDEARQLWRELGNLPLLADNLASSADLAAVRLEFDQALDFADEALQLSQSIGNLWNHAFGRYMIGEVNMQRGQMDEAMQGLQEALRLSAQAGLTILHWRAYRNLLRLYFRLGALDRVASTLEEMRADLDQRGEGAIFDGRLTDLLWDQAVLEIRLGQFEAAERTIERGEHILAEEDQVGWLAPMVRAELALARQDWPLALECINRFLAPQWVGVSLHVRQLEGELLRGRILVAVGQLDEAESSLQEFLRKIRSAKAHYFLWGALDALSEIERRQNHPEAAAQLAQEARQAVRNVAEHIRDPELRAGFLNLPEVRRLL